MTIILFDVDGTLTPSGANIQPEMVEMITKLSAIHGVKLGIVGGGTYKKIKWQMGNSLKYFKYIFAECGAIVYIDNILCSDKNMVDYCDRPLLNKIIGTALFIISQMPIIFHGQQIDFRKGLVYISPPGMQATTYERNYFIEQDKNFELRKNLLCKLKALDSGGLFEISFGGAVGIAVHPTGWNKSQVVTYLTNLGINDLIYYFGDRTEPDGNDYPIYSHVLINGISIKDYHDTIVKLNEIFLT